MSSYAIGRMIRINQTCETLDLHDQFEQTDGSITQPVQEGRDGRVPAAALRGCPVISYKMARRSFLRACGGSAALLLPMLRSIEARAAGAAAPLRFFVLHHPLGTQIDLWRPAGTGTTSNFTLPSSSAPFAPLQSKMVMIDGLHIVTARKGGGNAGAQTHEGGMVALMTGQETLGQIGQQDHVAGGASIDQIFLAKSPLLGGPNTGKPTPFGSLQLAADIRSDRDEVAPRVLSYLDPVPGQTDLNKARQPLYPETQPLNVFTRLFGGGMPSADVARYICAEEERARLHALRPGAPAQPGAGVGDDEAGCAG